MHIKIVGFKIHIDVDFIFENGTMILLRGESGCGKSTILQSIFWVLYGNMRGIYNSMGITKNLSVTLSLPDMTVFRKKNPELLTVKMDKIYEDQVAQSIIDSRYGNRELWKACSYIEQKTRCSLLEGSNKERMEVLNFLSFSGENPKEYIAKINDNLKEVTNEFNLKQAGFIAELNIFTQNLKENPVNKILSESDISKLKDKIFDLEEEEKNKHKQLLEQERLTGSYKYLLKNNEKLVESLNKLKNTIFKEISPYISLVKPKLNNIEEIIIPPKLYESSKVPNLNDEIIISYSNYIYQKNKLTNEINSLYSSISNKEKLENDLKELELDKFSNLDNFSPIQDEEVWKVLNLEKQRIKHFEECKSLGIEYDKIIIENTLLQLRNQFACLTNLERNLENYNKILNIETSIDNLKNSLTTDINSVEELEKLSREKNILISELRKGLELLSCPKCKISLRFRNGNLTLGERDPVSITEIEKIENEYNNNLKNLNTLRDILKLEENVSLLNRGIDRKEMENFIKSEKQKIPSLSNIIKRVENIKYIEIPKHSSEILLEVSKYQKLKKREENIIESLKTIVINGDTNILKDELNILEERYKLEQKRIQENQNLTKKYQEHEAERLKELSKYENEKKRMNEKERGNFQKLEKYKKEEEESQKKYKLKIQEVEFEKIKTENEIKSCEEKIKETELNLKEYGGKINDKCKEEYNQIVEKIKEEKKLLEDSIYGNKISNKRSELEIKRNSLIELQTDMTVLNRIKLKAIEIECKQLEDTVNNINTVLETTLPIFFPEPISLNLCLYKKIKTGNKIKPGLNLEISYKGMKYDNINSLSGGEGDRISLALLLALNSVSNSPIILLDECVSSLDGNLKENCITAIKSIPDKTIICVDHDDSLEGFYDSIIEVK
jgi:DNA repair exonuclease SbcCD ATPase subunit